MLQMRKIIMSKKFLPVLLVLTAASFFVAFRSNNHPIDNPKSKNEKILHNVGLLLEQGHYSPRKVDDDFSKMVLKDFLNDLDGNKFLLLKSDIDSFKKYEDKIDDEIHGNLPLESFYTIAGVFTKRLNEASERYISILDQPFDFTVDENVSLDAEKLSFPATEADRKETWRKHLKYLTLNKYADLLDEREKNKGKKDFVEKVDSTLEREARDQIRKQINRYFNKLKNHNTNDEMFSAFVNSITNAMDPHTGYYAPVDNRAFNEQMSGSFFGIGAQLKEEENKIKIASLVTGGPAWKSGELEANDEIIKIAQAKGEPVDVTGYDVSDAVKLIRGSEKGSEVRMTIRKPDGQIKVISLKRDEIKLDDTFAKSYIIKGEHKIGYIILPEFYVDFQRADGAKCSDDVAKEITKLKEENVDGIVIDLRGNGGGSLPEVVKMVGLFIEDGPVCQVRGRDEKSPFQWKDRDKAVLYSGPLAVMVDENSASASEIFAAAIQDYKRGIIIGSSSTYGKGTVQRQIPLNPEAENDLFAKKTEDLGTVKLTLQKFYRINGGATQLRGVTPDVIVPDRFENLKFREKDNPTALAWDEIAKVDYTPWAGNYNNDEVIKISNEEVKNSQVFNSLKSKVDSITKEDDKDYPLNLVKYRAEQKELKSTYKRLDQLLKLGKELNVSNIPADTSRINGDKEKSEKNKKFINAIKEDIYIDEAVRVTNHMISDNKKNKKGKA